MPYPLSLDLHAKQTPSLKQTQRLMMSPQMQQAIYLLQMPVLELSTIVEEQLQLNPVMEINEGEDSDIEQTEESDDKDQLPEEELSFDENDFEILKKLDEEFRDHFSDNNDFSTQKSLEEKKNKILQEDSIQTQESLFEYLMIQSKEIFSNSEELSIAEAIIGNLDEKGFLKTPLQEIAVLTNFSIDSLKKVLKKIQTFEPYGVGASNMQESLLIQLRCQQKHKTLAYSIIEKHYDDLIHNRIPAIKKSLSCSSEQISSVLKKDISRLALHPGTGHFQHFVQYITPDASVEVENDTLNVKINDDFLPPLRLNKKYMRMLNDETLSPEIKHFIQHKLAAAKWLLYNVHQRNETLSKIIELLVKLQKEFFLHLDGKLVPLTMKTIAEQLHMHESTIARAVANKYINTLRGILSLRSFFTQGLTTQQGDDISSNTIKNALQNIIRLEDKKHPLSDSHLCSLLKEKGFNCARRTVAKYRAELGLANAHQRRQF